MNILLQGIVIDYHFKRGISQENNERLWAALQKLRNIGINNPLYRLLSEGILVGTCVYSQIKPNGFDVQEYGAEGDDCATIGDTVVKDVSALTKHCKDGVQLRYEAAFDRLIELLELESQKCKELMQFGYNKKGLSASNSHANSRGLNLKTIIFRF